MKILLRNNYSAWILTCASLVPFCFLWLPSHSADMSGIYQWWVALDQLGVGIYKNDSINYPGLGVLSVSGIGWLVNQIHPDAINTEFILIYRVILVWFHTLNVLIMYYLLNRLGVAAASWWVLCIALLPSSWLGGAVWGQVDTVTQFFLLIAYVSVLWCHSLIQRSPGRSFFLAFFIAILLGGASALILLHKQLGYFSLPAIGLGLIGLLAHASCRRKYWLALGCIASIGVSTVMVTLPDHFLVLPHDYRSHILLVLFSGRSGHGNVISSNGFNLWTLFFSGSSSPILTCGLSVKSIGLILFCSIGFSLWASAAYFIWNYVRSCERFSIRIVAGIVFLVHGAHNLLFNIVLTGTHERYLFHCYPFLLMAYSLFGRRIVGKWEILIALAGALVYGEFVRSVLLGRTQNVALCLSIQVLVLLGTGCVLARVVSREKARAI